jgi:hypothetical protein
MKHKSPKTKASKDADSRESRLKEALKANLARRKAQTKARKDEAEKN